MNKYMVWDDEESSDGVKGAIIIDANHEGEAAKKFAEYETDDVYDYEAGRRIGVQDKDGTVTKWNVIVEYEPTFRAEPVVSSEAPC